MKRRAISLTLLLLFPLACSAMAQEVGDGTTGLLPGSALFGPQQPTQPVEARRVALFRGRVDHVAAGTSLRNLDSGTIRLRGIPDNSTVVRAFLYWAMICDPNANDGACPRSVEIEFQGVTIDTTLVATGPQPCWIGNELAVYRADVTGLMPSTRVSAMPNKVANGDYRINGIPSNRVDRNGGDPWGPSTPALPKAEGATLVVIYLNARLQPGFVHLHEGADFFNAQLDVINALVPSAPAAITEAKFTRFGADGQKGSGTLASAGTSNELTFFVGPVVGQCPADMPQIAGDGSPFDRDSDWNGSDGVPLIQLWDTHTTTVTGLLAGGAPNYCVRYVASGDCMNSIGYVLTVR